MVSLRLFVSYCGCVDMHPYTRLNSSVQLCRLPKLKEWIDKNDPGALLIPLSGALETKLVDMPDDEKAAYLKEAGATR